VVQLDFIFVSHCCLHRASLSSYVSKIITTIRTIKRF